jgi:hypothetical protein
MSHSKGLLMINDHYIKRCLIVQWKVWHIYALLAKEHPKEIVDEPTFVRILVLRDMKYPNYETKDIIFIEGLYERLFGIKEDENGQEGNQEEGTQPGPEGA